jgi:Protein of unknown function C-terminus (DUF2399)
MIDHFGPMLGSLPTAARLVLRRSYAWRSASAQRSFGFRSATVRARPDRPVVCANAHPGAAATVLLRQLAAAGSRLRYHGDFDAWQ